jgi:hypothetical protein
MILTVLVALFLGSVAALPSGSPVCTVGSAAPSSTHLSRNLTVTGPLSQGNFTVSIGALTLSTTGFNNISAGTSLNLELASANGGAFKGVLIVLNKAGTNFSSSLSTNSSLLQSQASCPVDGYSGFTHTSRELKTKVVGSINMPANLEAFLDVNVVVVNNSTAGSIYFYSQFQISTVTSPVPVAAPVSVPVPLATPISTPVTVPVIPPNPAPVTASVLPSVLPTYPFYFDDDYPTFPDKRCGIFGFFCFFSPCGRIRRFLGFCY